jgi:antirestriction protein ArdC
MAESHVASTRLASALRFAPFVQLRPAGAARVRAAFEAPLSASGLSRPMRSQSGGLGHKGQTMTSERFDIHQHITDQIISAIEKGPGDFQLPWHRKGTITRPVNVSSKQRYRGVNILSLWAASEQQGYTAGIWGTYKQWAEAGAQVRKGEKSSYIVFYKELKLAHAGETEGDEPEARLFARASAVFAAEQVDGFKPPEAPAGEVIEPIDAAERLVQATGAVIHHGGSRACDRPSTDSIQLPAISDFTGTATSTAQEAYYSTLLHELTHWTSAAHRCNRELGKRFTCRFRKDG